MSVMGIILWIPTRSPGEPLRFSPQKLFPPFAAI
uniref:Uncharacterized protein n=1 Tax=Setaria italica TaxID=4555 RepID=K3Z1Q7_SETIT